jgi:hypothetical protein
MTMNNLKYKTVERKYVVGYGNLGIIFRPAFKARVEFTNRIEWPAQFNETYEEYMIKIEAKYGSN